MRAVKSAVMNLFRVSMRRKAEHTGEGGSGDSHAKPGECQYRNPREYFAIFDAVSAAEPDGRQARFELVSCRCIDTYVRVKHNQNQARGSPGSLVGRQRVFSGARTGCWFAARSTTA